MKKILFDKILSFGGSISCSQREFFFLHFDFSCFIGSIRKALTEECQNLLKRFEEVIQSFITALIQGNISIKILRKLISRSVSFQKILIAMKNEKSEAIMMTLNIRLRELEAFDNTYQIVQEFTYVCIHCKGKK